MNYGHYVYKCKSVTNNIEGQANYIYIYIYIFKERLRKTYYIVGFIKEKVKRTQCQDMRANNHMCTFKIMSVELNELKNRHVTFRYAFKISTKDNNKILICLKNKK